MPDSYAARHRENKPAALRAMENRKTMTDSFFIFFHFFLFLFKSLRVYTERFCIIINFTVISAQKPFLFFPARRSGGQDRRPRKAAPERYLFFSSGRKRKWNFGSTRKKQWKRF